MRPKTYCIAEEGSDKVDDKSLINLFLERSEQAIRELETMYGAGAKALAFNVLGDARDAEECLSDALLAVWNTVPPKRPDSMRAYLLGITRNRAVERYHALSARKRNSHYDTALGEIEDCLAGVDTAETLCEAKALSEAINAYLAGLKAEDRALFVHRYWFGQDLSEAARALGMAPQKASLRLFRIRERLKKHLMKDGMLEWTGK